MRHVAARVGGVAVRVTGEVEVGPGEAVERLQAVVAGMWARSTSSQRQLLWARLVRWANEHGLEVDADTAMLFVLATGVSPQGMLAYAKALSGTMRHLGLAQQPLLSLASALRAAGGAIPQQQATPMPKEVLVAWALCQQPHLRLAALTAWKTAARWGEVCTLSSEQFIAVQPTEVIIDWHTSPKGRRANPFTASKWTVICGDLTPSIAELVTRLRPFERLTAVSTADVTAMWRATPGMEAYSGHSVKRGALTFLFGLIASGADLSEMLVGRLAKHHGEGGLSSTTIRYGGCPTEMARALRTQEVTRHL